MPNPMKYDVVVAGAGPAGIVAALQSARAGARTLLVEKSGICGGTTVLNGINFPGLFHAWGRQIIGGIGWELVLATTNEMGKSLPDFSKYKERPHWELQISVNMALYVCLAEQMLKEARADILFHTMPVETKQKEDGWHLSLGMKEGLVAIETAALVDATGDANLVRQAGLPLRKSKGLQPATLNMKASGYHLEGLDFPSLEREFLQAVEEGRMTRSDLSWNKNPVEGYLRNHGNNIMHVVGVDGETSAGKTEAELKAREIMLRIIRFMRMQRGLGNFNIESFAPECGIRETVTIHGEKFIWVEDYISGRHWDDSLCYSFYPIDVHSPDGMGIQMKSLEEGVFPTIPLGALLPQNSRNLIVAGRTASGDQKANSAYRVQASCMAMGQVAGAVAALSALGKKEIRKVPLDDVRLLLKKHRAVVPDP